MDETSSQDAPKATKRSPERRSMLLAGILLLVGFGAYQASHQAWFLGAYKVKGAYEWVPLDPATLATMGMVESPTGPRPAMYELLGMPASTTWILVAVGVGILAFVSRLGLLALVGVGAAWMGRTSALFAQETLTRGEDLAARVQETPAGLSTYLDWLWILMAVLVLLAGQVTYAAHVRRKQAVARGLEDEPGMLDTLEGVQAAALTRLARTSPKTSGRTAPATEAAEASTKEGTATS